MRPAEDFAPSELVGKRVAFRDDAGHAACWHQQMGLRRGVVARPARTLAQKAEMVQAEGTPMPQEWAEFEEVPRVWVKTEPCPALPRGCETAVELTCLLVLETSDEGRFA